MIIFLSRLGCGRQRGEENELILDSHATNSKIHFENTHFHRVFQKATLFVNMSHDL